MMPDQFTVLEQLDWHTLTCRCQITEHCPHQARPCTNQANRQIEFHAIDHCNNTDPTETVNPLGNYVFLLCLPCLNTLAMNVEAHILRLNRFGRPLCLTCGAAIAQIDHVIRGIEAI